MKVTAISHHCDPPILQDLPSSAAWMEWWWRCDTCGQRWKIRSYGNHGQASPRGKPSRKWRRNAKASVGSDELR